MKRKRKANSTVSAEIRALDVVRRTYRDDEYIVDRVIAVQSALAWEMGITSDRPSVCWRKRAEWRRAKAKRTLARHAR